MSKLETVINKLKWELVFEEKDKEKIEEKGEASYLSLKRGVSLFLGHP